MQKIGRVYARDPVCEPGEHLLQLGGSIGAPGLLGTFGRMDIDRRDWLSVGHVISLEQSRELVLADGVTAIVSPWAVW